jgi:large repetitive protein
VPTLSQSGTLPSGVSFNASSGILSGTPAAGTGGTYNLSFTASNGVSSNATQSFTLTVNQAPAITSANNTTFTVGTAGSFTVTKTGVPTPSLSQSGALPSGVTFNSATGVLSGTPAAGTGGTYSLTFTASNGVGANATQNFTLTVNQAPAITSANNATFTVGSAGSFTVTATGFPSPTLSRSGTLPSGVTFNAATRVLSGTPAAGTGGNYNLTFTASNGVGSNASQNFTLTVNQAPAITSANSATFTVSTAGSFTVTKTGFPTPSLSQSGALPSGVTFNTSTGVLSGTPAAGTGGTYNLSFTASNGVSSNATQSFTLTINQAAAITSANTTTFAVGAAGTFTVTASGFPAPTLSQSGTLPSGVTFNPATRVLSGTPAASTAGNYNITFTATNGVGAAATQNFTLVVNQSTAITSANSTTFTVGTAGSFTVTTAGSPTPTLSMTGTLPSGVTFNSATRVLGGNPAAGTGGIYNLTFTASNGVGSPATQNFTLTVNQAPAITSGNSVAFTTGTAGSFTVTKTGFPAPTLSQSGTLPSGVTFNASTGLLGGTPAAGTGGAYNLTFTASNGVSPNAAQSFTLTVNQAPAITSANNTLFTVGTTGSFTVTKTGFPAPSLSVSGALPSGITFNTSTGVLGGTPATGTGGTYNLTFTASNGVGSNTTQSFTLTVNTRPTISAVAVSRQQGSQIATSTIANVSDADGGTLTVTANAPTVNGVTLSNIVNNAGTIRADIVANCTATNASFTLTVTDNKGATATANLLVTVTANTPPAVGNYPNSTVVTGGTLTITPDVPPTDNNTVVSVTATAVPNFFTGTFSGNTSSGGVTVTNANPAGSYTISVTLTDNCGATTTRSFMLMVSACGAVLSKQRELFAANGGTDSFTVTIDAGCSWTATSDNPDWITINAPGAGFAGPGTVSYTVATNNTTTRRTGSLTVAGQTYRVWQSAQFGDVPLGHPFYDYIGKLSALGITLGCGNGNYCPDTNTTREQMAIFIERALGISNPPLPSQQTFQDVPLTFYSYPFIEDLVARGVTAGCDAGPPRLFCPTAGVTREQMAIFILRGLGVFNPPAGPQTPTFADVPNSGATDYSYEFIEEFVRRGITSGCASGPLRYCPTALVTRGQMAVFLVRAFGT